MTKQRTMRSGVLPGIGLAVLLLFSVWAALFLTSINYAGGAEWSAPKLWLTIGARAILLFIAMAAAGVLFAWSVLRNRRLDDTAKGLLTIPAALVLCVLALEFAFMFVPRSHGYGASLSARIWTSYYWRPVNDLGYRSVPVEFPPEGIKKVLVVGDSFTEGHGIKHIRDRYPELLGRKLGGDFQVFNAGQSGADSAMEYQNLLVYPVSPDILILQYFGNDIEYTCQDHGLTFGYFQPYRNLGRTATFIARNSFLVNFIYWLLPQTAEDIRYTDFLIDCFHNEEVLKSHLDDLGQFVAFAQERHIPLYVVIFPFLEPETERVNYYVPLVSGFFRQKGIPVISVDEQLQGLGPAERMVNLSDGHASQKVHARVADALYAELRNR